VQGFPIDWWAVLVAAIVKFAIGGIWYSNIALAPRGRALAVLAPLPDAPAAE